MTWWIWILAGLGLLVLELLTPGGFFILFFGVAAILVGALAAADLLSPFTQWVVFSILSVASMALFRRRLVQWVESRTATGQGPVDSLVGETAILIDDLDHDGVGKAELRGAAWTVRSREGLPLARGQRCLVESVEGLTLYVRPE